MVGPVSGVRQQTFSSQDQQGQKNIIFSIRPDPELSRANICKMFFGAVVAAPGAGAILLGEVAKYGNRNGRHWTYNIHGYHSAPSNPQQEAKIPEAEITELQMGGDIALLVGILGYAVCLAIDNYPKGPSSKPPSGGAPQGRTEQYLSDRRPGLHDRIHYESLEPETSTSWEVPAGLTLAAAGLAAYFASRTAGPAAGQAVLEAAGMVALVSTSDDIYASPGSQWSDVGYVVGSECRN